MAVSLGVWRLSIGKARGYVQHMTFERTLMLMATALALMLLSLWRVRRKPVAGAPPWVPWHGVMFVSLFALIGGAAHLPAVWP
jgi:hypothetical protein